MTASLVSATILASVAVVLKRSSKGAGAAAELTPRLRALLGRESHDGLEDR